MKPIDLALLALLIPACATAERAGAGHATAGPPHAAGSYSVPPRLDDGWPVASPEDLGLDRATLEALTSTLRAGEAWPDVHGLLIVVGGKLVYEEYFAGNDRRYGEDGVRREAFTEFDRDTLHDLRSATKSVTSGLVGIAVAAHLLPSPETPLAELFPSRAALFAGPRGAITVRHALTMTAGLEWNEEHVPYTDPTNDENRLYGEAQDSVGYVVGKPLAAEPGTQWSYDSGLTVLLGLAVSEAAGSSLRELARERLFEPLGIRDWEWRGPPMFHGEPTPAGNLWLRPRDVAKFGSLYLTGGEWHGRRILPPEWVEESTKPLVPRRPATVEHGTVCTAECSYGYQWWHDRYRFADGSELVVWSAAGNGGQRIWLVPELRLLAVHLTGRYDQPGAGWQAERLLLEWIVPWARGEPAPRPPIPEGRPTLEVDGDHWNEVVLSPEERALYVGTYDEGGVPVQVWDEGGVLKMTPPAGGDQREIHLIPEGDHVFAQGRYEGARPTTIYWPDARVVFVVTRGRVERYEVRSLAWGTLFASAPRLR